jgi:Fibronectin type III domain
MYFANDGGVYRALDGFGGLTTGSCSGTNQFDDLNQNLGSMTQFVGFSQHPTDPNTLLGGTQDNGSPATNQATSNSSWMNVLGGDGGYNAIDPNAATNFYASNPDVPPGGLGVQLCSSGVNCTDSGFSFVATSGTVGGDDGAFYFPYILDPQSPTALLIGTCRVWRGPRTGGAYAVLSPNFDTLDSGTCSGSEVNQVRALAAGGPTDSNGSLVLYTTTSGLGPIDGPLSSPTGGHVWVTTNATAGVPAFADVTGNGPQGSINPNQFPVSSVAIDPSDATGATAYVTVMGFTGSAGHVWKTTNAGAAWTDFTANLPDSPVNAVVVDPGAAQVYAGTDVGVFASSTSPASWTELGPASGTGLPGVLPNVAVTALGLFSSGGQKLLRASTYGRGIWQFSFGATPDFQIAVSNSTQTVFVGQTATFSGTASELNGYANSITLSCVAGTTAPPSTCSVTPSTLTPVNNTPFTVTAGGASGNYIFNVQAVGSDPSAITRLTPITLNMVSLALSKPSPASVTVRRGTTSAPVSFQITAGGSFNQSVTVLCTLAIPNATCTLTPATPANVTASTPLSMTATVTVPGVTVPAIYPVTIQASAVGAPTLTTSFSLNVTFNPNFTLTGPNGGFPEVNSGSTGTTGPIVVNSQDGFNGTVTLAVTCPVTFSAGSCTISPASVSSFPTTATLTIKGTANGTNIAAGAYSLSITGTSGSLVNSIAVPFNVGDYTFAGPQTVSMPPGGQGSANFTLGSSNSYSGNINATCNAGALSGATCTLSPANPIAIASGGTASFIATINVPNNAAPGVYSIPISTQDTTGAPSHALTLSLKVAPDFILTSSTPSQTVSVGQTTGPYSLTLQPVGYAFNSAVTLSCSGLPSFAQCLFNPSTPVTPGNSAADVVMSISTSAPASDLHSSSSHRSVVPAVWLLLPGIVIGLATVCSPRKRRLAQLASSALLFVLLTFALLSCGGVSTGGGNTGCSAAPSVPTGLTSSSTTSTGTALNWASSTAIAGCTVTGYVVYQGSTTVATPATTSYSVTGLSPSTQYSFSVAARDSDESSAQSTSINVTTLSSGTPPGTYTITVTGTSAGAPPDAGQSTQVTLVVH